MLDHKKFLQGILLPLGVTTLFWVLIFTAGLSWLGGLPAAPEGGVGNPFYYLVKGSILWVPLGFIFALAGRGVTLQRWLLSGVATFLIVSLFSTVPLGLRDYMEALFALIGVWTGLWLGGRMGVEQPEAEPVPVEMPRVSLPVLSRVFWLRLPFVLVILGLAGWAVWSFSHWQVVLGAGLLVYFLILLRFRHAWLFLLPALLPTLNLAPWSGRISLDEFDLVMLVTLSGAIYHGVHPDSRPLTSRPIGLLLWGYGLICVVSFFIGLYPIQNLDINSFDNYFSGFNSWTVAKGFLWGFLFLGLVRWTLPAGGRQMERLFVPGLLSGLFIVALVGLRERWQFANLMDFSVPYRITATFSSMHTGGAHLDTYLALLLPIIGYWMVRSGRPWVLAAGSTLFVLAVYLVISTVTRTTFVVLVMEMALMISFWLRRFSRSRGRGVPGLLVGFLILAVALPVLYLGAGGGFFQQRLQSVERDTGIRMNHWGSAVEMMEESFIGQAVGMGFGRFPAVYLEKNPDGVVPGRYAFTQTGGNTYLTLYPGETLYLAQKVAVSDQQRYRLALDVRSPAESANISAPLCEKQLLNSKHCRWLSHRFDGASGQWQQWDVEFNSDQVGEGNLLTRRPVELSLYNPNKRAVIDVDNVSLKDAGGNELLNNGTFEKGGDFWFLKTHQHLPWHIKNLWVSALFEQGWLGATLLTLLILALVIYLSGPAWYSGNPAAIAVFVAMLGLGATGLFASPFDAPRITLLFFLVISFGLYEVPSGAVHQRQKSVGD